MQSIYTVLELVQLRWTSHIIRMPDERHPKKVFYGGLQEGKRSQGARRNALKTTAVFEGMRISEAERKRREHRAKTNGPPDSMALTCCTCNRQLRDRIGLVSHQRTRPHA